MKAERATTPSEISRRDLSREVLLTANLDGLPLGTAAEKIKEAAAKIDMAPGYQVYFPGEAERMEESFGYMAEALLLAVVFVYLILAAQFESFIDPLSIMLSLPLSIVGMAGMLALTGDTLSIMSLIGLILLMGLVTKNAILLVDYTKVLRKGGMERREALITAGRTRLRPIMMTTLAMIFGMLPLALGLGQGAEMRAPLGRAVIGGLITSTVLTLLVVPVVYALFDDFAAWIHGRWAKANALEQDAMGHTGKAAAKTATATVLLLALLVPAARLSAEPAPSAPSGSPRVLTLADAREDRRRQEPRRGEGAELPGLGPRQVRRGARRGAPEPLGRRVVRSVVGRHLRGPHGRALPVRPDDELRPASASPRRSTPGGRWAPPSGPPRTASPPPTTSSTTTARRPSAT